MFQTTTLYHFVDSAVGGRTPTAHIGVIEPKHKRHTRREIERPSQQVAIFQGP